MAASRTDLHQTVLTHRQAALFEGNADAWSQLEEIAKQNPNDDFITYHSAFVLRQPEKLNQLALEKPSLFLQYSKDDSFEALKPFLDKKAVQILEDLRSPRLMTYQTGYQLFANEEEEFERIEPMRESRRSWIRKAR